MSAYNEQQPTSSPTSIHEPAGSTQPPGPTRRKVATCNLRNLASAGVDFYPGEQYSQSEYDRKIKWTGTLLGTLHADVIGFQEVFHEEALHAAVDASGIPSNRRVIVADGNGDQLKPRVALATTLPIIGQPQTIHQIPEEASLHFLDDAGNPTAPLPITAFSRPVLRVELELWKEAGGAEGPGVKAIVDVVHLKSMNPEVLEGEDTNDPMVYALGEARAQARRTLEAAGLRALVLKDLQGSSTPVIVLGDCNAGNPSVVTSIMSGPSPWRFLKPEEKKKVLWDRLLYDAADLQSKQSMDGAYYTHIFNGHYELLDRILLSEEFYERNPSRVAKVEYVRLFTNHLVDTELSTDPLPRWQSDHGWVVVTLRRDAAARIGSEPIPD